MTSHHAHLSCVLEVDLDCDACKRHAMEVLGSLDGVYSVNFDAGTKTCRIMGEVDPNYCLKALVRCGYHAKLQHCSLVHPRLSVARASHDPYRSHYYRHPTLGHGYDHRNSHGLGHYGVYDDPYPRPITQGMSHDYLVRNALPNYSYNNVYPYGRSYDSAMEYMPNSSYDVPYSSYDQGMSMCTIM